MSVQRATVTKILLKSGADPNIADHGWTPLMYALQNYESTRGSEFGQEYREIAEMLVVAGARLDILNQHGLDAFYYTNDEELKKHLHALAAKHGAP
jgi:ankyrin repeat protein